MFNIKKIILVSIFVLFSAFLFIQQASAQACCELNDASSTCDLGTAQTCISVKKSFVDGVVNIAGQGFNNLPGLVTVTDNSFIIQGTDKIEFILDAAELPTPITLPSITNISFSANKVIDYRDIRINKNPPSPVNITLDATDNGIIRGGDIYSGAIWGLASDSGNITVKARVINILNIIAWGFGGNGGDITFWGDHIIADGINTSSMIGRPHPDGGDRAFGNAGQITIKNAVGGNQVTALKTGDLFAYGVNVNPVDIVVEAEELIWIRGDIKNMSGCDLATRIEKCDYVDGINLCDADPITYPYRRYCGTYGTGGKVGLKANGIGKDRGIFVAGEINNSANSDSFFDNTNVDITESYTGAGLIREISLTAPNGLIYVDSINSIGFHIEDPLDPKSVFIRGNWVQIRNSVITDNFDVYARPGEAGGVSKAGNIVIQAIGGDKPIVLLGSDISAKGNYAFAPDGGNVTIESDYRIEGVGGLIVDTSGRVGPDRFDSNWYIIKGVSEEPGLPGAYISDTGIFCAEGNNEYYNGTDGSNALAGGNGGNITIAANVVQWISGGGLDLKSNGGNGGNGGLGGDGSYCGIDSDGVAPITGFTGPVSHVVPDIGRGGAGSNGGAGGIINIQANSLHCFDNFNLSSFGGAGGTTGGDFNFGAGNPKGNLHTGNCDLTGWQGENVPDLAPPALGGNGGNAGNISLSMPTDKPVTNVGVFAFGGEVFNFNLFENNPYPWYCTSVFDPGPPPVPPEDDYATPCQNSKLDTLLWTDGFIWIFETERTDLNAGNLGTAYIGQKGPDGGDGGAVIINSLIDPAAGININYDVSGKDGKDGTQGQNSTVEIGGRGGQGGDGGDAGVIQVPDPGNFDRGPAYNNSALRGGSVGNGGFPGASVINLPKTSSYFDPVGSCQNPDDTGGHSREWWGDWIYSVATDKIYTLPPVDEGPNGLNPGAPGRIDPIILISPGTETCSAPEPIEWFDWPDVFKNTCFRDFCIEIVGYGPDDCVDDNMCIGNEIICGDGESEIGEECGEPDLPLCPAPEICINCQCESGDVSNSPPTAIICY